MGFFSNAQSWISPALETAAGETINYYRGTKRIAVTAVRGSSEFTEFETTGEIRAQSRTFDWLIATDQLVIDGFEVRPERGDQLELADGTRYDVAAATGSSPWEWSDAYKTHFRVHTTERAV